MQKTKVTIQKLMITAVAIVALFAIPHTVSAGSSSWDFSGDDYGYYSNPSYSNNTPSYSYPSYSYPTPSYSYSYDYPSYSSSSYKPVDYPSYSYDYAKPAKTTSKSTSKSDAKAYSYVYSNNTNTNKNTNTNTNVNTNNVNVVVYGGGGFSTTTYNNGGQNNYPQLVGDCQASPSVVEVGQNVSFQAYATGGTGSYSYQWSGADGLYAYGQSFSGRFYSTGTKYAYVQISSGSQTVTRTCSVEVRDHNNNNNNLSAYCIAEPQTASVGQTVTWRVYTNGSNYNDNYYASGMSYNWSGTDGLTGSGQYISRSYNTSGTKYAYVTVYSNGRTYQAQCTANIYGGSVSGTTYVAPTTGTPVSGVFLSQLPATGIDDMLAFKDILIATALVIWAAFMAYVVNQKKRRKSLHLAEDRIAAFKAANLAKKA